MSNFNREELNISPAEPVHNIRHEVEQELKEKRAEERAGVISLKSPVTEDNPLGINKKYKPLHDYKVYRVDILDVELHDLADEHPMHTEESRNALKDDLEINGQNDPVILYRGKIVDGRHRYWLLKELGIDTILVRELPSTYTLEDVRNRVLSTENRRHQTPTQRGIQAYLYSKKYNISFPKAAGKFGASTSMVKKASYADKHKGEKALYDLYHGKKVAVGIRTTDSLSVFNKLIYDELEAIRKARSTGKSMAEDDVRTIAQPYLDALGKEHTDVIAYVSKRAYRMAEER